MTWLPEIGRDPVVGYVYLAAPSVVVSGGPDRVVRDEPDPGYRPRPVGFAPGPRHRRPGPALDLEPLTPPVNGCSDCRDGTCQRAVGSHRAEVAS